MDLVDFGLEPVVTDSRFNEVPQEAVDHVLTATRDEVTHTLPIFNIKENIKCQV